MLTLIINYYCCVFYLLYILVSFTQKGHCVSDDDFKPPIPIDTKKPIYCYVCSGIIGMHEPCEGDLENVLISACPSDFCVHYLIKVSDSETLVNRRCGFKDICKNLQEIHNRVGDTLTNCFTCKERDMCNYCASVTVPSSLITFILICLTIILYL